MLTKFVKKLSLSKNKTKKWNSENEYLHPL